MTDLASFSILFIFMSKIVQLIVVWVITYTSWRGGTPAFLKALVGIIALVISASIFLH